MHFDEGGDDEMYASARKEKFKELRKLLHELMLEGDEPMSLQEITEAVQDEEGAEVEGDLAEEAEVVADDEALEGAESVEEELSPLEKMKRDYFKPKPKLSMPKPGTAVAFTKIEPKKPAMFAAKAKAKSKSKMA